MAKRKTIKKSTRFEVFKRDKFTCQYCGRTAPDVILQLDHIQPVSKNGQDNILNYITACVECNIGKGAKQLADTSVILKQKRMLDELQERREQIEMMLEWQKELSNLDDIVLGKATEYWNGLTPGFSLNNSGVSNLRKVLRKYPFDEVLVSMRISSEQYLDIDDEDKLTDESVNKALDYIEKICHSRQVQKDKPYMRDLYYIRGIIRKRFAYTKEWQAIGLLEQVYLAGVPIDELKRFALDCNNWSEWVHTMQDCLQDDQP